MVTEKLLSLKVQKIRKQYRLTQRQLGKIGGVEGSYITRIEKGTSNPSLALAFMIERGLRLKKPELSSLVIKAAYEKAKKTLVARVV